MVDPSTRDPKFEGSNPAPEFYKIQLYGKGIFMRSTLMFELELRI